MKIYYTLFGLAFLNGYSQTVSTTDAKKIMDCININHHIETVKETTLMWIKPEQESEYLKYFEPTVKEFEGDIVEYYQSQYSSEEIKQILDFYNTGIGKKIADNVKDLSIAALKADEQWEDAMLELVYKYFKK